MDFITHLPITNTGHDSIVMFVDRLTKRVHIEPCYDTSAEAFAEIVLHTIFKQNGLPLDIVPELDSRFSSLFWTEVFKRFGIKQNMSTAYHPRSDWQTDRVNRLLEGVLRANVSDDHLDCAEHLPLVEFAVNNSVNSENGTAPLLMDCGQAPLTPSMASLATATCFDSNWRSTAKAVKARLHNAQHRYQQKFDEHASDKEFQPGDLALLPTKNLKPLLSQSYDSERSCKLMSCFLGPLAVLERLGKV
jgi:hypothetical protein